MLNRLWLLLLFLCCANKALPQCGGSDIFIANDQSGSVDANENIKSREFLTIFAQSLRLSNTPGGYRIAIADWDYNGGWKQFDFPNAGKNYTTDFSDIVSYAAAPRVLFSGTDLVMALQQSYVTVLQDHSERPKVILLMTDAMLGVTQPALVELAQQIKASGIYIAILSVSTPFNPILADAASPGGYFLADSYDLLASDAASFASDIGAAACLGNIPAPDLSIRLTDYHAENCFPGPGDYTLNYEVKNSGNREWNDSIVVSLFNGDLYEQGTSLIKVFKTGKVSLQPGETYKGSFSSIDLQPYSILNAIVNFDGSKNPIAIPIYPFELYALLQVEGERSSINNYSNLVNRSNGAACVPIANVIVEVQADSIGCGNTIGYTVNVCNRGTQDTRIMKFTPLADASFSLIHADVNLDSTRSSYTNTYFGGTNTDYAYSAVADAFGGIYIAGQTNSNNLATAGAYRSSNGGTQDAFLTKFNAAGERLWATYFGGLGPENGYSICTDKDGNIYMTGETSISTNISTATAHQPASGGGYDAYLAKFNGNGALQWATYYGGSGADYGRSVATDNYGNVYLAGITASANNIATTGAQQTTNGGGNDAFLVKFNTDGVRQWATYYGGSGTESGFGVAVDAMGSVYLTGLTGSTNNISTSGSYQPAKSAGNDAYLVKFNSDGVRQWATYFGGNNSDNATGIAIDNENDIYITGNTSSTNIATANAFQKTNGGGTDAFLSKFSGNGSLLWSTFYGGTGTENGRHIHAGKDGYMYFSGTTASNTGIASTGALQETNGGNTDAFLVKFDKSGSRAWGTYFGGANDDVASASVSDALGKIYLIGATQSAGLGTLGSFQPNYAGGGNDAFMMSLDEKASFILKAGSCVDLHYYYNASKSATGTYDFSFLVQTEKLFSSDPNAVVEPDKEGFVGVKHTTDNVIISHNTYACQPGDKLDIALDIPPTVICGDASYVTATIKVNNTSGIAIKSSALNLLLSGTNARYAGELYGATNRLRYGMPNIADPLYPNTALSFTNKTGEISVPLYDIQPGISIVKIEIAVNSNDLVLSAYISGISTFFNASGKSNNAVNKNAVSLSILPTISGWSFPDIISFDAPVIFSGITVDNGNTLHWASTTAGTLTGDGTLQHPLLTYQPSPKDIANGTVQISLTALNADGCDVSAVANITIKDVQYDYGDAPAMYDANQQKVPMAAGATSLNGLHLGQLAPSTEPTVKSSAEADGDGIEEDALIDKCPSRPLPGKQYKIKIAANNLSGKNGFINGFMDWNNDGDFFDENEKAIAVEKIIAQSGRQNISLQFICPPATIIAARYMVRLRLSTDSSSILRSYGPAPEGETEDHWLVIGEGFTSYQEKNICEGEQLTVGKNIYTKSGTYSDTLIATTGCDSIIQTTLKVGVCGEDVCGPFIPSAFTPNGDGHNDEFGAVIHCPLSQFTLVVFNRWGQKVFESNNPSARWNGQLNGALQPSSVFVWQCSYMRNGIFRTKKGTVTLIQ